MVRIRLFEDRVRREFGKGDMPGFVHTYVGAEAVAVGVCAHLTERDLITSTHRGHGHCLAKGVPIAPMVAELYGRETGLCKGRGGSMHVADFGRGMLGANAIVGGGISLAVGGALAAQTLEDGRVSVTFFGDGASNEGIFHESLEPRFDLAAAGRVRVREQRVGGVDSGVLRDRRRPRLDTCGRLRHPRASPSTVPTSRRYERRPATPSSGRAAGDGPNADRGTDPPPRRALRR